MTKAILDYEHRAENSRERPTKQAAVGVPALQYARRDRNRANGSERQRLRAR